MTENERRIRSKVNAIRRIGLKLEGLTHTGGPCSHCTKLIAEWLRAMDEPEAARIVEYTNTTTKCLHCQQQL